MSLWFSNHPPSPLHKKYRQCLEYKASFKVRNLFAHVARVQALTWEIPSAVSQSLSILLCLLTNKITQPVAIDIPINDIRV